MINIKLLSIDITTGNGLIRTVASLELSIVTITTLLIMCFYVEMPADHNSRIPRLFLVHKAMLVEPRDDHCACATLLI